MGSSNVMIEPRLLSYPSLFYLVKQLICTRSSLRGLKEIQCPSCNNKSPCPHYGGRCNLGSELCKDCDVSLFDPLHCNYCNDTGKVKVEGIEELLDIIDQILEERT